MPRRRDPETQLPVLHIRPATGVPIKVMSKRLGHSTIAMTMDVYAYVLPAMYRAAADRFGDLLA